MSNYYDGYGDSVFEMGGSIYPSNPSSTSDIVTLYDPSIWFLLNYYQTVINYYHTATWQRALTITGLAGANIGQVPIAQIIPYCPTSFEQGNQYKFPLLSIYSIQEEYNRKSQGRIYVDRHLELMITLPPLCSAQFYQISPFLKGWTATILEKTFTGFDPSYQNGLYGFQVNNIMYCSPKRTKYGIIAQSNTIYMPTIKMEIDLGERNNDLFNIYPLLNQIDGYNYLSDGYSLDDYLLNTTITNLT